MTQRRNTSEIGDESSARLVYCDEGVGLADLDAILLVLWRGEVTRPRFTKQRKMLIDVVARHPGRAGLLCVVEAKSTPPDEELRKATMQMINDQGARLRAVACVIEGEGFRAAMSRSVLSGLAMLLVRSTLQYTFAAKVETGATWLASRCGVPPEPLIAEVGDLRARIGRSA